MKVLTTTVHSMVKESFIHDMCVHWGRVYIGVEFRQQLHIICIFRHFLSQKQVGEGFGKYENNDTFSKKVRHAVITSEALSPKGKKMTKD